MKANITKRVEEELNYIGEDLAGMWGGYCKNHKVNWKSKKVTFDCVEHGDEFYTELTFDEIKKTYGMDMTTPTITIPKERHSFLEGAM